MMSKRKQKNTQSQFSNVEAYRQLRTNIEYSSFNEEIKVIAVISANPGEGKSTVSSELAKIAMAKYNRVLLVDCDLRKPKQHKIFHVSNALGLSNLMKSKFDDMDQQEYFKKFKDETTNGRLFVLTSGKSVPNPQELLGSERFKTLLDVLKEKFDYIILDCPPVNVVADAVPVSKLADGTILVVSAKETDKRDSKNALTTLQRNGCHVLGSVLTKVESTNRTYKYYGHYSDSQE